MEKFSADNIAAYIFTKFNEECSIRMPVMQLGEGYAFSGVMVATSIDTAEFILKTPYTRNKHYYVTDFEWMNGKPFHYGRFSNVFHNLNIIAANPTLQEQMKKCWNIDCGLIEDFNYDGFKKLI